MTIEKPLFFGGAFFCLIYWVALLHFWPSSVAQLLGSEGVQLFHLLLAVVLLGPVVWLENTRVYLVQKRDFIKHRLTLDSTLTAQVLYPAYPQVLIAALSNLKVRLCYFALVQLLFTCAELFLLPFFLFVPFTKFWLFSFQMNLWSGRRTYFRHVFRDLLLYEPPGSQLLRPQTFRDLINILYSLEPEEFLKELKRFTGYDPLLKLAIRSTLRILTTSSRTEISTKLTKKTIDWTDSELPGISEAVFVSYIHMKTLHFPPGSVNKLVNFGAMVMISSLEAQTAQDQLPPGPPSSARRLLKDSVITSLTRRVLTSSYDEKNTPLKPEDALLLKSQGVRWTNLQCRMAYLYRVRTIPSMLAQFLKSSGWSPEQAARLAYNIRHRARVTARAMMTNPDEVATLKLRDLTKYDTVEGPSFEWLVNLHRKRGLEGDAIYSAIEKSSCCTDEAVNGFFSRFSTPI